MKPNNMNYEKNKSLVLQLFIASKFDNDLKLILTDINFR